MKYIDNKAEDVKIAYIIISENDPDDDKTFKAEVINGNNNNKSDSIQTISRCKESKGRCML